VASESGEAQTRTFTSGGRRTSKEKRNSRRRIWKYPPKRVTAPYSKKDSDRKHLSSAGPEESCVNLPAPSGKAKYS